jgi:spoIIIJ-associated protein
MKSLEISAKTVEEAIQLALETLGVNREDVKVTVLRESEADDEEAGGEEAKVRVETLVPASEEERNVAETAKDVLETLLTMMGLDDSTVSYAEPFFEEAEGEVVPLAFNINGDDLGILIGRRGQTLASLQYIVRLIVGSQTETWLPIVIDVEGYKRRRYAALQALAERVAEQVKTRRVPFTLEPMSPYERRIIHLTLASYPDVITESTGVGDARKVVIIPEKR